jgi:thiosulfate dehydrogenase [quinone] large subunit
MQDSPQPDAARYVWALTRLSLGWVFLWAFLDKTFGLGHETPSAESWTNGGSPTKGFLSGSTGAFSGIYHDIAGTGLVDALFMVGLLFVGVTLMLGIVMRLGCAAGALMVILMWTAYLPPANNLFMDDHIIYALVLVGLALVGAGNTLGLGRWWSQTSIVQRNGWLA